MFIEDFEIRSYSKTELAQLYNPGVSAPAARRLLRQWIAYNSQLHQELRLLCTSPKAHIYSPRQVETIIRYLGIPG
jgi:hypothetical protein